MKNNAFLISLYLVLLLTLNSCAPQIEAAAVNAPSATTVAPLPTSTATATVTGTPSMLSGTVSEVAGNAEVKLSGEDAFTPAQINSLLDENGQAMTGSDGKLRLDLSTGTIVRLAPNSLFTLISNEPVDNSLKTRLQLAFGELFIILNGGSMEVDTPTGTAAVRGSYMSVSYDSNSGGIKITCLEGNCSLKSAGGDVEITAGQTAIIIGIGQPPQVGEMSDEDIQKWLDFNPEAQVIVDALFPPTPPPTEVVYIPQQIVAPIVIKKNVKEEKPASTATPAPAFTSTIEIVSIMPSTSAMVGETISMYINVWSQSNMTPTGTVKVRANGTYICSTTLDVEGAICEGSISSAGTYTLTAEYLGDVNHRPSSATWGSYVILLPAALAAPASTTTDLMVHSPYPSLVNTDVTFTAIVSGGGAGTPSGSVTFADYYNTYTCTAPAPTWTCTINFDVAGSYAIQATYNGDANFAGSSSGIVTHDVLANSNTQFSSPSGPDAITLADTGQCSQAYSVFAIDVDQFPNPGGVNVEYSIDDPGFTNPIQIPMTANGNMVWEVTASIPAGDPSTVYWRFSATDNSSNTTTFGSYSFNFASGVSCP